jgi:hypothetical protein
MTMQLIETKTLGAAAASIEFTSIPQTFTDLVFLFSLRITTTNTFPETLVYQFNSSSSGYTARTLVTANTGTPASFSLTTVTGTSFTGGRLGDGWITPSNATASTFANASWYIPNYTSSVAKSHSLDAVSETNGTAPAAIEIVAGLSSGTAAIDNIKMTPRSGDFAIGSMFSLYGVLKGSDGIVTTS